MSKAIGRHAGILSLRISGDFGLLEELFRCIAFSVSV